jgi:tetratricopeptide (TPR) repeat protein
VDAYSNRGEARAALGDLPGALADFNRALELAPRHASALLYHNRGSAFQVHGHHRQALRDFDEALAICPSHAPTFNNRGKSRHLLGDLVGALADFDRALELTPPSAAATIYHNRGGVRLLLGDRRGAIQDYDMALALDPALHVVYLSRGHARYHQRDPESYLDYLHAFAAAPEFTVREIVRVLTMDLKRDAEAVLNNCRRHLRINSGDIVALARRSVTLLLLGRDQEAAADASATVSLCPAMEPLLEALRPQSVHQRVSTTNPSQTAADQAQGRSWTCDA